MNVNWGAIAGALIPIAAVIATFAWLSVASWGEERRKEREALYRSETLKKAAEVGGPGAQAIVELLREQELLSERRRVEGIKLAGIAALAAGIGVAIFLYALEPMPGKPLFAVGVVPALVGLAMLVYVFALAPRSSSAGR